MTKKSIQINFRELAFTDLNAGHQALVTAAVEAMEHAHAPYSRFRVGCAISLQGGQVITGNNQENAAYPSGLCAERVAIFAAKSQHQDPIATLVVVAKNHQQQLANAFSCGSCRQVIMEYASMQKTPITMIFRNADDRFIVLDDAKELLPFHFNSDSLQ